MIYVDDPIASLESCRRPRAKLAMLIGAGEQRADAADDSGDVLIANQKQKTLERRFDVNVVHAENTQHIVEAIMPRTDAGSPAVRRATPREFEYAGAAPAAYLYDLDPARLRKIPCVDQVDGVSQDLAEDAFQHAFFTR